jgi:hypothetical protein
MPVSVLFLLAPAVGEMLSGSTPPLSFINPLGLLYLAGLCGSGAILAREFVRQRGLGRVATYGRALDTSRIRALGHCACAPRGPRLRVACGGEGLEPMFVSGRIPWIPHVLCGKDVPVRCASQVLRCLVVNVEGQLRKWARSNGR